MAYVKHEWSSGQAITAQKLNEMEDGIADANNTSGNGGIDLIIKLDQFINYIEDISEVHLEYGSWEHVMSKFSNNQPITALVYTYTTGSASPYSGGSPQGSRGIEDSSEEAEEFFLTATYMNIIQGLVSEEYSYIMIRVLDLSNSIVIYLTENGLSLEWPFDDDEYNGGNDSMQ